MLFSQVEEYREINWYTADWVILSSRISCSYNFFFFHTARHSFASVIALANNVSLPNVSKMLGHSSTRMTQHYAKVLDQSILKDMQKVDIELSSN